MCDCPFTYAIIYESCKDCPLYKKNLTCYFDEDNIVSSCRNCRLTRICKNCYMRDDFEGAFGDNNIIFTRDKSHANCEILKNNVIAFYK